KVHEKVLKAKPQVIIATPERFLELCETSIKTTFINTIVFDEADMTMDLGFASVFQQIFNVLSPNKNLQKIAFSATLHDMLSRQISLYFKDTKIIDISENIWKNDQIKHILIHDEINIAKEETLKTLISSINPYFCIIFCNTIDSANKIYELIKGLNINVGLLHGKLESRKRKNVYKDIQNFKYQYLVATDLASRGLDIDGASHIISFDLPKEDLWYIHRSGRSGRGKYNGESYVLFDKAWILNINRLRSKGIKWESLKIKKGKLEPFEYVFKKQRERKETEVDKKIQHVINTSSKKVKPGYKKKLKAEIKKIKQKEKRKKIDASVKKILVVKYKKENAAKTKIKQEQAIKREKAEKRKSYY
ncbi:MAG: helicase-related protein, partial [Mycoplasmoidaceae bacterium]